MKKALIFIFLANIIFAQDTSSPKFMPLKINNVWVYEYSSNFPPPNGYRYRFQAKITKDTIAGNKKLFYLDNTSFLGFNLNSKWFWIDSANGNFYQFITSLGCRNNQLKFLDSLKSNFNELSSPCSGIYRKCYFFGNFLIFNILSETKRLNGYPELYNELRDYSKNLGVIFSYHGEAGAYPTSYTLTGCIIDGIVHGDTSLLTGINQISSEIPGKFELSQNYPNPFNPTTQIGFRIAESGLVRLTVFDMLGKEIDILVNQEMQPGSYEADWNASAYPSGVYYYKLESGSFAETKKMILIK